MSDRVSMSNPDISACSGDIYEGVSDHLPKLGVNGFVGERLAGCFGDAKVDHFWNGFAIMQSDKHILRLNVSMNHTFLMCVLHCLADWHQ